MAYKSDARGARAVRLVAVHTAEGARTAASLGAYFYRPDIAASSHVGIDAGATLQYVPYDRSAWTLRTGNPVSDNAELCGFASMTRAQWLGTATANGVANPRALLDRTAEWIRARCLARGIPMVKISPSDVAAGKSGVIGHIDWTLGARDGSHTDPGSGFPWDYVMDKARGGASGGGSSTGGGTPDFIDTEDSIMELKAGTNVHRSFRIPDGATAMYIGCPEGAIEVLSYYLAGDNDPPENGDPLAFDWKGEYTGDPYVIDRLRDWRVGLPEGATHGNIAWTYEPKDADGVALDMSGHLAFAKE